MFNYDRKDNAAGFMLNRRLSWVQLIELYECKIPPKDISAINRFYAADVWRINDAEMQNITIETLQAGSGLQ